jgi:hypothetical protein
MKVIIKTTLLSSFLLTACAYQYVDSSINSKMSGFRGDIIEVKRTITVENGMTFDGKGNLYSWVGEGDCSQTEGMPAMFDLLPGSTLKNVWIENAPDGIHVKGENVTIDNITNIDVCEDAISISKPKGNVSRENIKIINSKFYDCEDKAIQLTRGTNVLIKNNEFISCAKAVRIKEQATNIIFENNKVYNAKQAIKATGGHGLIRNNVIQDSKVGLWAEEQGHLIDAGGNSFINVKEVHRETEAGKITVK